MAYLRKAAKARIETPQSEPIPGSNQVANSAGGYSWAVDDWKRLDRFIILGSEGGSYYASEKKLTRNNSLASERCVRADGPRVVKRIVEISEAGRAPKNDPALYVLAMCAGIGDANTKKLALESLPKVARIGTHLFHFVSYVEGFRGWGRGLRTAVGKWYSDKDANDLAFQVVKYQQRDGWGNADLLRLTHPKFEEDYNKEAIARWSIGGLKNLEARTIKNKSGEVLREYPVIDNKFLPKIIQGFEAAQHAETEKDLVKLIDEYRLTMEMIPNKFLNGALVWEALLPNLGYTAIIRNLGNMSKCGFLKKGSWESTQNVVARLSNKDQIKRSRVHPISVLTALLTYSNGRGVRGDNTWNVVPDIVDALDEAFYTSFGNVEPAGKRVVLALDISGSMSSGVVAGVPGLTPRVASSAMAMVTYKTEPKTVLTAFTTQMHEIDISRKSSLKDVCAYTERMQMGGTDCALPMLWALQNKVQVDLFEVLTDSETWAGRMHPSQALDEYNRKMGLHSKLVVVGMVSNEFSIADPARNDMMDVVGFDTASPNLINSFARGDI